MDKKDEKIINSSLLNNEEQESVLMPDYEDDALMLHSCDSPASTNNSGIGGGWY